MARPQQRGNAYQRDTYIDGNTVRRVEIPYYTQQALPEEEPAPRRRSPEDARYRAAVRRNRERELRADVGYVLFIVAAAAVLLFAAVIYLRAQAEGTTLKRKIASLESTYSEAKLENDENYARTVASADLESIKEEAINRLGMVYPQAGQIVTYDEQQEDYVKQYTDVPGK